jgi:hypothetical protein
LALTGNAICLRHFFQADRAHIIEAVRFMASETGGRVVTVGSFQDSRNAIIFEYADAQLPDIQLRYIDRAAWSASQPDWLIVDLPGNLDFAPVLMEPKGRRYSLMRAYRCFGLSGFCWYVYRSAP